MSPPTPFDAAATRVAAGADHHHEARRIVEELTLDEKLGCLDGDLRFWPGTIDMVTGGYSSHPWPAAVVERLGIPGIAFADGPRGCVVGPATAFPVSMARGASFDPVLEERIGDAIGAELRARGATYTGAVCMNLLRHPAWGRAQETYGEDPHHVGEMATALTTGLQHHVMACMKHFALNSMENARFTVDVRVDERALHEVYLPHFRRVAEAGVASVMSAYNKVNGEWCGENAILLRSILRDEWGFDGFVTSDFTFGVRDAVASVHGGLNIEMPFRMHRAVALPAAIEDGTVVIDVIDDLVAETVATLLRFAGRIGATPDPDLVAGAAHRELAHEAAVASMVLVRNDGILPLRSDTLRRVAVLGPLAAVANLGDQGSSNVNPPSVVTPLDGLLAALPRTEIIHADRDVSAATGSDVTIVVVGTTRFDEGEFLDQSGIAPLATLFPPMDDPTTGFTSDAERDEVLGRAAAAGDGSSDFAVGGGDRRSLRLPDDDEALLRGACAASDRVVVCLMGGSAFVMPWLPETAATLLIWYPGMEGGRALADVLLGVHEPGGRLPFAVPHDECDLVDFDPDATQVTYGLLHGQWKLDADGIGAHLPFGFGLGYAAFSVDGARPVDDGSDPTDRIAVDVTNLGLRPGSTVVQVYASIPGSAFERPPRRLVGFGKVNAEPGETITADITLDRRQLDVRVDGAWVTEDLDVVLHIGQCAGDEAVSLRLPR